jgi:hypothetical protein
VAAARVHGLTPKGAVLRPGAHWPKTHRGPGTLGTARTAWPGGLSPAAVGQAGPAFARVVRVARYASFPELLAAEDPARIDLDGTPAPVLQTLREIYTATDESLGVIGAEIELAAPSRSSPSMTKSSAPCPGLRLSEIQRYKAYATREQRRAPSAVV